RERLARARHQDAEALPQRAPLARVQRSPQNAQRARLPAGPAERAFQARLQRFVQLAERNEEIDCLSHLDGGSRRGRIGWTRGGRRGQADAAPCLDAMAAARRELAAGPRTVLVDRARVAAVLLDDVQS